jgi:hypothetical protein
VRQDAAGGRIADVCTVIVLLRPRHAWPLILAANRDERLDRAWDPPGAHWPEHPGVVGGRDRSGGGTWMARRGHVVAAVLNRPGSLGPAPGKRSRGALPLIALAGESATAAADRISALPAAEWRPFNMVIADDRSAYFLRGLGKGRPQAEALGDGVTMVTAHEPNDQTSPRIGSHLPRFRAAAPPDPDADDWTAWEALLADDGYGAEGIGGALNVPPVGGFGTVCSSLIASGADGRRLWRFSAGRPGTAPFRTVVAEGA